jgi:hypothetical protein
MMVIYVFSLIQILIAFTVLFIMFDIYDMISDFHNNNNNGQYYDLDGTIFKNTWSNKKGD